MLPCVVRPVWPALLPCVVRPVWPARFYKHPKSPIMQTDLIKLVCFLSTTDIFHSPTLVCMFLEVVGSEICVFILLFPSLANDFA